MSRTSSCTIRSLFGLLIIASLLLAACQPASETPAQSATTGEKIKVGLSFSDFDNERWIHEEALMRKLLEAKGYQVLSEEAKHDVKLQNEQIDRMVADGAKALIVVAEDGAAVVSAIEKAAEAGVKVLAYDRLIKTPKIAAYISFDNVEVGRQQALGVLKAVYIDQWDVAANGKLRLVKLAGSPTDNNAILFRQGQDEIIQQYAEKIEIVGDQWVNNWDGGEARRLMENILSVANNDIDAVVASNDITALGALEALRTKGLAGKTPISGQDATAAGCNSIVKGELSVSILKDIRKLSPLAVDLVDQMLRGKKPGGLKKFSLAELTNDPNLAGDVTCYFLPVEQITKDNVLELVVKSEFQSYADVYRDIPEDQLPPEP